MKNSYIKEVKDIILLNKPQDVGKGQIQQIIQKKQENNRSLYLCKLHGQSALHAVWVSSDIIERQVPLMLREFNIRGSGENLDKLLVP